MAIDGERVARLEALFGELRGDVQELKAEEGRTRTRLHGVEGLLSTLVEQEKVRIKVTRESQQKMRGRLQLLTVVVALAALLEPFLYHVAIGG